MSSQSHPIWLRRLCGGVWLAGWFCVLRAVHRPWGEMGGLVSERLRWFERFVLAAGLIVGSTLGELLRNAPSARSRHAGAVRWLLYPAAVLAALAMVALRLAGREDPIGVVFIGLSSYTAGALSAYLRIGAVWRASRSRDTRSSRLPPDRDEGRARIGRPTG